MRENEAREQGAPKEKAPGTRAGSTLMNRSCRQMLKAQASSGEIWVQKVMVSLFTIACDEDKSPLSFQAIRLVGDLAGQPARAAVKREKSEQRESKAEIEELSDEDLDREIEELDREIEELQGNLGSVATEGA